MLDEWTERESNLGWALVHQMIVSMSAGAVARTVAQHSGCGKCEALVRNFGEWLGDPAKLHALLASMPERRTALTDVMTTLLGAPAHDGDAPVDVVSALRTARPLIDALAPFAHAIMQRVMPDEGDHGVPN